MTELQKNKLEFWVKWSATAFIMAAVALTSGNWLYPWNLVLYLIGNTLWIWTGFLWRQWPVIVTNIFANVILVVGYTIKVLG